MSNEKMEFTREEQEALMVSLIGEYSADDLYVDEIKEKLVDELKYTPGMANGIMNGQKPILDFDDVQRCAIVKVILNITGNKTITLEELFKPAVIKEAEAFYINEKENIEYIEIKKVDKLNEDQYQGMLEAKDLNMYTRKGVFTYNFQTQRQSTLKETKGRTYQVATLNKEAVKNIKKEMVSGNFDYSMRLHFNMLQNEKDRSEIKNIQYNEETRTLRIYFSDENTCDIADGYHRITANKEAMEENPGIKRNFPVIFTNYTASRTRYTIQQNLKFNEMNETHAFEYDTSNPINNQIKLVLESDMNEFGVRKLTGNALEVLNGVKWVQLGTVYKAFDTMFDIDIDKFKIIKDLKIRLASIFNYIDIAIENNLDDFENIKESRKNSYITQPGVFVGLLAMAEKIDGKENSYKIFEDTIKEIDFSINNKSFDKLALDTVDINKKTMDKIAKHFRKLI